MIIHLLLKSKGVETISAHQPSSLVNKIDGWYKEVAQSLYASYFLTLRIGDRILEGQTKKTALAGGFSKVLQELALF